ncbi:MULTISPECIES: hypothetical protein [Vibrio diabolicus subgroup]|uniref:Response regulator VbsA n=2 Tax=Vibrio antiquarius (strain Ex25) TaxID=150340 RepID=A0ACA6QS28_VIBAE|nr:MULTISPECIES: hypothetical protein [Vibrio diabolicus subgroup]ACY52973.1 response regulator VbsA [Vibrio antiquarius]EDN57159.1 response regulator VbsA [Vibrio antiquarius]MCG6240327.1 hypothetical protein [Vibrio diabolicus]
MKKLNCLIFDDQMFICVAISDKTVSTKKRRFLDKFNVNDVIELAKVVGT